MKVNIQKIKNRFTSILGAVVVFVSCLLVPVSAADSYRNEFVDMHEYSTYTFPEDNSEVYVDCRFPQAWIRTEVYQDNFNGPPFAVLYGSPIEFETARYGMKLQIQPVGSRLATGNPVGTQVTDAHIIDLTVVPKNTWFHSGIVIYAYVNGEDDPNAIPYHGYQILYFVDKDGKVVYRDMYYMPPVRGKTSDGLISFSFGSITDLASMPIPDTAVGVVPVYELHPDTSYSHSYYVEYVEFSKFRFSYNLSVLEYESQQNERLQGTMDRIEDALTNGTPEQNQAAQDAVNSMQNASGKLDEFGDAMKVPEPDMSQVEIKLDKLVDYPTYLAFVAPINAIWDNTTLVSMLIIVATLVIVSWVFFGKKG